MNAEAFIDQWDAGIALMEFMIGAPIMFCEVCNDVRVVTSRSDGPDFWWIDFSCGHVEC